MDAENELDTAVVAAPAPEAPDGNHEENEVVAEEQPQEPISFEEPSPDQGPEVENGLVPEGAEHNNDAMDVDGAGDAMHENETKEEEEEESGETEEEMKQQEMSYSTRGRSADLNLADPLERLARDVLGDLAREKEAPSATRESFLSDSLTEEERRTRTRFLPEVDGMQALRKSEVKGDLALARSIQLSAGGAGTLARSKRRSNRTDEEGMDVDEFDGSEDDRISDISRLGTKTIEIGSKNLMLPSTAFVAPPVSQNGGDSSSSAGARDQRSSPREVEAVVAFNPPRPLESVGAKKKHRMLRWERRPADIDVDLSNYRKTVKRTREELKNAEAERERIETVGSLLRHHFLTHISCLNEELAQLNDELSAVQQDCINAADLLTSRTRSRGAGKGSYAMRDVLTVLRSRGSEIEAKGLSLTTGSSPGAETRVDGAGGVGILSFKDWDCSTSIEPDKVGHSWILPGDTVQSPYGEGPVVAFYAASRLNVNEPPHEDLRFKTSNKTQHDHPVARTSERQDSGSAVPLSGDTGPENETESNKAGSENGDSLSHILSPRVAVRLPYGIGFFPVGSLVSKEDPATYADPRLAERWKGMVETAASVGATLDIQAMSNIAPREIKSGAFETNSMELDETLEPMQEPDLLKGERKRRLVPFGAGMLPTANGRGDLLWKASLTDLDKNLDKALFEGAGVLGRRGNVGVPREVREIDDQHQEHLDLQAKVLQLKNELYRQRRTRMLNERTYTTTQDRALRVESLVDEMRADLKSLKTRLNEEIRELEISEETAENILTTFYTSLDSKHSGEASPPKRPRRQSRLDFDDDDDMDEELGVEQHETK